MSIIYEKNRSYTDNELKIVSNYIRSDIIKMLNKAGSGHLGGSLGLADIFTVLYYCILKQDPKKPEWKLRDLECTPIFGH